MKIKCLLACLLTRYFLVSCCHFSQPTGSIVLLETVGIGTIELAIESRYLSEAERGKGLAGAGAERGRGREHGDVGSDLPDRSAGSELSKGRQARHSKLVPNSRGDPDLTTQLQAHEFPRRGARTQASECMCSGGSGCSSMGEQVAKLRHLSSEASRHE